MRCDRVDTCRYGDTAGTQIRAAGVNHESFFPHLFLFLKLENQGKFGAEKSENAEKVETT